jgi:hypothetical protein
VYSQYNNNNNKKDLKKGEGGRRRIMEAMNQMGAYCTYMECHNEIPCTIIIS